MRHAAITVLAPLPAGDEPDATADVAALGAALRQELGRSCAAEPDYAEDRASGGEPHRSDCSVPSAVRREIHELTREDCLHFAACFVIPACGSAPAYVGLELSCSARAAVFRELLVQRAPRLLSALFHRTTPFDAECRRLQPRALRRFLRENDRGADAFFIGCPGRGVPQIRAEESLRVRVARDHRARPAPLDAQEGWRGLQLTFRGDVGRPPRRPLAVRWGAHHNGLPARLRSGGRRATALVVVLGGAAGFASLIYQRRVGLLALAALGMALSAALLWSAAPTQLGRRGQRAALRSQLVSWLRSASGIAIGVGWLGAAPQLLLWAGAQPQLSALLYSGLTATIFAGALGLLALLGCVAFGRTGGLLVASVSLGMLVGASAHWGTSSTLALAVLAPPGLLGAALTGLAYALRVREFQDPDEPARVDPDSLERIQRYENHSLQNHLAVVSPLREGKLNLFVLRAVLRGVALLARYRFNQGDAAGIRTIHFLRFLILPDHQRLLFLSNYDGGFGAYLDDFRVARPMNAVWGNTRGFPRTFFLLGAGARDERRFKAIARQHQIPSLGWWSAYPDLRVADINAATATREDLFRPLPWSSPLAARWQRILLRPMTRADCDRALRRI